MKLNKDKTVHWFIIGIFTTLYFFVATMSMINSVTFFELAHSASMSWALAIAFEMGSAASLASIVTLDKMNKTIVWILFWTLTLFQAMSNSFDAFTNLHDYQGWIELFGLTEEEPIFQKRVLSILSGAILPLVALGFIKSLVDYIKPSDIKEESKELIIESEEPVIEKVKEKTTEEKMVEAMSEEDRQKILDFIKEKADNVDNELKKDEEIKKEETPEPEEQKEEEIKQVEPQHKEGEQLSPAPLGGKGTKWSGKARIKGSTG